jgi:hypothetical protein
MSHISPGNKPAPPKLGQRNPEITRDQLEGVMSVIDFFEYLAAGDDTADLAHELADVWVAHQIVDAYEPAA